MHMGHNHGDIADSKEMDHIDAHDHEHGGMDHSMQYITNMAVWIIPCTWGISNKNFGYRLS